MTKQSLVWHCKQRHFKWKGSVVDEREPVQDPYWMQDRPYDSRNVIDPFEAAITKDVRYRVIGHIVNIFTRGKRVPPIYKHFGQLAIDHYVDEFDCEPTLDHDPSDFEKHILLMALEGK